MSDGSGFTVTLTAQEWNVVLGVLGQAPFSQVAGVIGAIQNQCQGQNAQAQRATPRLVEQPQAGE